MSKEYILNENWTELTEAGEVADSNFFLVVTSMDGVCVAIGGHTDFHVVPPNGSVSRMGVPGKVWAKAGSPRGGRLVLSGGAS